MNCYRCQRPASTYLASTEDCAFVCDDCNIQYLPTGAKNFTKWSEENPALLDFEIEQGWCVELNLTAGTLSLYCPESKQGKSYRGWFNETAVTFEEPVPELMDIAKELPPYIRKELNEHKSRAERSS